MTKIPTSFLKRGSKLLGIASKIAFEEVSSRLKTWEDEKDKLKSKINMARDIVKTLKELKGASMKVGQLLSLDFGDYLPPEVVQILEELHEKSTFLNYEKIEAILKIELGDKFYRIKEMTKNPIAAASIGQVHKAILDGKEIVIKVQYPGVAESIPSDLKILEVILNQLNLFQKKSGTDLSPFLNEIKEVLLKEADYRHELQMHKKYKTCFNKGPYIIPNLYPEFSTEKVLVQEYIHGLSFSHWLETNPLQEIKEHFAHLLMKLYLEEIFIHGIVQTDPNPGNFLITPNNEMALIDFGAVKEYSNHFIQGYKNVIQASYHKDREKILDESFKLGFIDVRETQEVKDIFIEMMDFLVEPFRNKDFFDFSDKNFFNRSRDLSWEFSKKCKFSPPPKDLLFLHRKLGGVFIFIKKMDVKIKLSDFWHYVEK